MENEIQNPDRLPGDQITVANILVHYFNANPDQKYAMTSVDLVNMAADYNLKTTQVIVRKIVHYIRINHLVEDLIASSLGYYVEHNPHKVKTYVESLRHRADEIFVISQTFKDPADATSEFIKPDLGLFCRN